MAESNSRVIISLNVIALFCLLKQLVDDVEFWFPPGKDSVVEYRSASRTGNFDFDANRKRIKVCELIFVFSINYRH